MIADTAPTTLEFSDPTCRARSIVIEQIQTLNPTASATYLAGFRLGQLTTYLEHLQFAAEPRVRGSRWVRRPETPAIMGWAVSQD